MIGYFASIKTPHKRSKVHMVYFDTMLCRNKPICHSRIKGDFQWCAADNRDYFNYVDCEHCKRILTTKG